MSMFRVSSSVLRQKASQLSELNARFKNAVERLASQEASLASMWEGDAQKAFRKAFNDDRQQFENFYKGIAEYIRALQEAAQRYDEAEAKNLETAKARR